jgi:hypothetical protein
MPQRTDEEWRRLAESHGLAVDFDRMRGCDFQCEAFARAIRAELIAEFKAWLDDLSDKDTGPYGLSDYPPKEVAGMVDEVFKP